MEVVEKLEKIQKKLSSKLSPKDSFCYSQKD